RPTYACRRTTNTPANNISSTSSNCPGCSRPGTCTAAMLPTAAPVPASARLASPPLEPISTLDAKEPAALGEKSNSSVQLAPAARTSGTAPQLPPARLKGAAGTAMELTVSCAVPSLRSVTVACPVASTNTCPKSTAGTESASTAAVPVPERVKPVSPGASALTPMACCAAPSATGLKVYSNVHVAVGASVMGNAGQLPPVRSNGTVAASIA